MTRQMHARFQWSRCIGQVSVKINQLQSWSHADTVKPYKAIHCNVSHIFYTHPLTPLNIRHFDIYLVMDVMVKKVYVLDPHRIFFIFATSKIKFFVGQFYEIEYWSLWSIHFLICINDNRIEWFWGFFNSPCSLAIYSFVVMSIKKNSEN